ncbi:MAG: hypothetical protein ACTSQP_18870 [Promethearchaeota archaeon]
MNENNIEILKSIFNWLEIKEISEKTILEISKKMNNIIQNDFYIKSNWSYFKKYTIFSKNKEPLIFLKYVREKYFQEVLGVHLTRYFFDSDLGFQEYTTGLIYKKKSKSIPYLATTFERGKDLSNYDIFDFKYELGRLCYLHEILCLYDVYDRHFIVREEGSKPRLCRIDFGRCFENLHKKYLGFQDYLNDKKIDFYDEIFQKGYQEEKEIIKKNLKNKKRKLINLISKIKELAYDKIIIFNPIKFANRLIDHWSRIGFLRDVNLEDLQWI